MIGRGLIANPALAREIKGGDPLQLEELKAFHDEEKVLKAIRRSKNFSEYRTAAEKVWSSKERWGS